MNYFSSNLKYLREKNGMEQIELAHKLGRKSPSSISEWEKGKYTPKSGVLSDIAEIFGVSLSELMQKDLTNDTPSNLYEVKPNFVKIPILGEIACGEPLMIAEQTIGYMWEMSEGLPHGELFALVAKGDSMEPTIPNGVKVLVRQQNDVENGEIAAVLVNGDTEATLKRVKKQGGVVMLVPDNTKHEIIVVNESNPARIIGKVVRAIRDFI